MAVVDDMELAREFARTNSEQAFAELVRRHVNLVYSVAWRQVNNAQDAEDVAQAVFIILARKAGGLNERTVLTGWLYETTCFTASRFLRAKGRRRAREEEAVMQSKLIESDSEGAWQRLAPHLEAGMSRLSERERTLIALRFYENKSGSEAALLMGIGEPAAYKRTARALEKLRKFFAKRGIALSVAVITGTLSANSLKAAPPGLAKTITAVGVAKGVTAGGTTLALVKGGLKFMAWAKAKTAVVVAAAILAGGTSVVLVNKIASQPLSGQRQILADGSVLTLDWAKVGPDIEVVHGTSVEKLLGNLIPSNGVNRLKIDLARPTKMTFDCRGYPGFNGPTWLVAEFSLTGPNATNHPLAKPAFFRQFRFVMYGQNGIEYAQELWAEKFMPFPEGLRGYIVTSRFPRDSQWLGFRVEQRANQTNGGPWQQVADLKIKNPARPVILPWVADPVPDKKSALGMDFVLGEVTVKTFPYQPNDIWDHFVNVPVEVRSNGMVLTNWSADYAYQCAEDASGNWDILASHRSLDPRFMWKLGMDFQPNSGFPPDSLATIKLPKKPFTITTNVMGVPVTISWDGRWMDMSIPTNRPEIGLRFVSASVNGEPLVNPAGSWSQFAFRKGDFAAVRNGLYNYGPVPAEATFAIVPNVHVTFFAQPRLLPEDSKN